jgi:DNA-binding MarR family transcriptional regulator
VDNQLLNKRGNHVGRLLLELHKSFIYESISYLQEAGFSDLLPHHFYTIAHIDIESGCEISELVEKSGTSKQAVSNTLRYLENKKYIKKIASELDARSKKIFFTKKGIQLIKQGMLAVQKIETKYSKAVGKKEFIIMKAALEKINEL